MRHPRVPSVLGAVAPSLSGGGYPVSTKPNEHADTSNISAVSTRARTAHSPIDESSVPTPGVDTKQQQQQPHTGRTCSEQEHRPEQRVQLEGNGLCPAPPSRNTVCARCYCSAIAASVYRQKLNADNNGRGNTNGFKVGSLALLAT
ncbi:hypothetical protein PR001_g24936 [Phytophthora rubi]|uniref:Uncharacterized protein n=1 Tax=Phytophthora rubi TaxID=129364 RepID=A0A6A3I7K3_9STRA|nr:hypothetical protein PR001_g24936 [Phytophthora rubi]